MQDDAPPPIPTPSARAEKSSPGERAVAPTEDMPTVLFGNFLVVSKLGEGGMGVVYEAKHQKIGRRAAVKVLHPELAQNQEYTERFLNEMRGPDSRREFAGIRVQGMAREARAG